MDKFRAWCKRNACILEVLVYVSAIISFTLIIAPYVVN